MCRICEGANPEDLIDEDATRIAVHGYMLQGVVDADHQPWVYTTGLLDAAEHPELIVAGASVEESARVLTTLADAVLEGEVFAVGDTVSGIGGSARIGAVDTIQYGLDTFNMWHELHDHGVLQAPVLTAVQVLLGSSFFCTEHQAGQPNLADPNARVGERRPGPNRAARRRRR